MPASQKRTRLRAANDQPLRVQKPVVVLSTPRRSRRLAAAGVLLVFAGLMAVAFWPTTPTVTSLPVAPKAASVAGQTKAAKTQELTDIVLPAESLSPAAVNIVAGKIADLPVLNGKGEVAVATTEDSYTLLARAYDDVRQGDYEAAVANYDQVLSSDNRNHDALTGKIYALAQSGAYDEAAVVGRHLLKLYPHDDVAAANLAHILAQQQRNEEAIAYMDRAARAVPENINHRLDLAALYDRAGHKAEALTLYRQVLAAAERDDVAALPLAQIRQRAAYLAGSGEDAEPSTTLPVDN